MKFEVTAYAGRGSTARARIAKNSIVSTASIAAMAMNSWRVELVMSQTTMIHRDHGNDRSARELERWCTLSTNIHPLKLDRCRATDEVHDHCRKSRNDHEACETAGNRERRAETSVNEDSDVWRAILLADRSDDRRKEIVAAERIQPPR